MGLRIKPTLSEIKTALAAGLGMGLSAVLLTVIQPPLGLHALAWVALVPFVLTCRATGPTGPLLIAAYTLCVVYWLVNLSWIAPITTPGWIALGLYLGLLWPVIALALRTCGTRRIPLWLGCAVIFTGAEALQGRPMDSFAWRFLAHSQYQQVRLIQIADLFGAAGVSFLIAMVNGLLADLVLTVRRRQGLRRTLPGLGLTVLALALTLGYGQYRVQRFDRTRQTGPVVAAVQSNVPQSVKDDSENTQTLFNDLMAQTRSAIEAARPDLVVWPETMVQAILCPRIIPLLNDPKVGLAYQQALKTQAKDRTYLLVGAYGAEVRNGPRGERTLARFNSSFLYRPDGLQDERRYDKIHLVLFGESMPFRHGWTWLYRCLMTFSPYDYDYSLDPGNEYTIFDMAPTARGSTGDPNYGFGVLICYEDTIPSLARRFVLGPDGRKRVSWLVNQSNDGWFVQFKDHRVLPSSELIQHVAVCVFRAVENRVAVLRSVNTGISCLIDPCGRLREDVLCASDGFPAEVQARQGLAGWFAHKMPIDTSVSLFSRSGQWLDIVCAVGLGLLVLGPWLESMRKKREKRP